ncbi:MAG: YidC/Oxa1 family membrane protein insertase [Candidatus Micrarchaeota archaeon]
MDALVIRPIINLMLIFYKFLGQETIVAVVLITALMKLITTPLMLNQQRAARRQLEVKPKLEALQEKYKNDRERLAQEQMKLYQEIGLNPLGGCLPLLIQLPLLIGLYQAIIRTLAATPLQLLALPKDIYNWIPGLNLGALIPLKNQFLWLDLALPDPYYVLPILVVATSYLYQKLITPPATDPQTQAMNQNMMIMMPIFIGVISVNYASGIAVYFLISNIVGILQYYLLRQEYDAMRTLRTEAKDRKHQKAT